MTRELALELASKLGIETEIEDSINNLGLSPAASFFAYLENMTREEAVGIARRYGFEAAFEDDLNKELDPVVVLLYLAEYCPEDGWLELYESIMDEFPLNGEDESEEEDEDDWDADEILDGIIAHADYWIYHQNLECANDLHSILREIVEYAEDYLDSIDGDNGFNNPERSIEVMSRLCNIVIENYYSQSWTLRPNGKK